jgi:TonB-linked SusC/RagA family outer membrane protein
MDFSNWRELVWYCAKKCPLSRQNWRAMRLSLVLILASVLQVQAYNSWAQDNVSLSFKNAPIQEVFMAIHKQTGYNFAYNESVISKANLVTIDVRNISLKEALAICFNNQPFQYEIEEKIIIIREKSNYKKIQPQSKLPLTIEIKGKVLNEKGEAVEGVTVRVKGSEISTITDKNGDFYLTGVDEHAVLVFTHVSLETLEVKIAGKTELEVKLKSKVSELVGVEIVNTGYQEIPKERATGSFVHINNQLINRSVTTNILERLDGITSGLLFNKNKTNVNQSDILIRGRNTLFADDKPLIVIDNFPFDGELQNINPNDVESITVLRDAASASIWGARSGNGVIVITTKKGSFSKKATINATVNLTHVNKPDLFYQKWMPNEEWLEVEQFLFNRGAFNSALNSKFAYVSPAVEIMQKRKLNQISSEDSAQMINALKSNDIRRDMLEYIYRPQLMQQYMASLSGGSSLHQYYFSIGFDRNLESYKSDSYRRFTINAKNSFTTLDKRFEISAGILLGNNVRKTGSKYSPSSPYLRLTDDNGNPASVPTPNYRLGYTDTAGAGMLLDWSYHPLDELSPNANRDQTSYIVNLSTSYQIVNGLSAALLYQHNRQVTNNQLLYQQDSYYARNLINRFSVVDYTTGNVKYGVPLGAILDFTQREYHSNKGRFQLAYEYKGNPIHNIHAIGGVEIRSDEAESHSYRYYGYDIETKTNANASIDFFTPQPTYHNNSSARIESGAGSSSSINKFRSYYANFSYSFRQKYTITASGRRDESNLFGVKPNQKGVPLWHAGAGWEISREQFYTSRLLPYLRLRISYGYNGNISQSVTALLTAETGGLNNWQQVIATLINPPNPSLRWERIGITNVGIDFSAINKIVSGNVEFYYKKGIDLIGESELPPQTGNVSFTGNSANTQTHGMDIVLNLKPLKKEFQWEINYLLSYAKQKVTGYKLPPRSNADIVTTTSRNPVVGYPYFAVFAYRWGGLDSLGNPTGLVDGKQSTNYTGIRNSTNRSSIAFLGSGVPQWFGSIRNNFYWRNFVLSFNIVYKLDYVFMRTSTTSSLYYSGSGYQYAIDYPKRWQQPGDENYTNVPSINYPSNSTRDAFYSNSEVLMEKADQVRLNDIRLSYEASYNRGKIKKISFYTYISNIGIIWKANRRGIDPDVNTGIPAPLSISFGAQCNF